MRSVVVIYDVSSMCGAGYIYGIRYSCCIIFIILKTQCPILLYGVVRNVDRKSQESCSEAVVLIYIDVFDLLFKKKENN